MQFGEKLKALRIERDMTQPALAEAAKIGLPTLKDYEAGRRSPSLEIAQRLAAALGVSCQVWDGVSFGHAERKLMPTAPPTRRTGRKMPAKPKRPRAGGA